jgi:stage V sporulation protein D (sporulation-specific penicillin-binding protein)
LLTVHYELSTVLSVWRGKVNYNEIGSKKRVAILLFAALILLAGLVLRVLYLQVFMAGWLKKSAEEQRFRALTVLPRRGTIYDRLGNELAISVDGDSVYAIPAEIGFENKHVTAGMSEAEKRISADQEKTEIANIVAGILVLDPNRVKRLITSGASFVWIKRKASIEEVDQLRLRLNDKNSRIHGIEIAQKAQRFYPQSSLAGQVLGISGIDNQGLEGLERQYDQYLRGVPGSDQAEFDTTGRHIPQGERRYLAPVDGDSLILTIDQNIQYIVERELDKAIIDTKCKRAMAITVDPQTGEILALACRPSFDPNRFGEYPPANRRNPIFTDMYEPGSAFKVFTTVAALEEGQVTPESKFFDPGYIIVDDRRLKCWKPGGHGSQTFIEALENSCNPVFASIALRLTKETFYKYIKTFGFGAITDSGFPGESPGRLQRLEKVKNVELATIGYGQGISVTPIQMAMGVCAIANGGYLLKPQLVKEITSPDGKVKQRFGRQVIRQVISSKTATLTNQLLQQVVTNGSGLRAYLEGYRVAGKTATADKVSPGIRGYSKVISSFVGYAPADHPQVLTLVILDEPDVPVRFGGVIAAPVVGNIFKDTLRYLGVKPRYEPEVTEKISREEIIVPNIQNMPTDEAVAVLQKKQIAYRFIGNGSYVFDQVPKPGAKLNRNSKVIIYFDPEEQYQYKPQSARIVLPNFQGLSLRKVNQLLTEMSLKLEAKGTGVAVGQEPPPGTVLEHGSSVKVIFTPKVDNLP